LEFDGEQAGEKVSCPHCGKETVLFAPPAQPCTGPKSHAALVVVCALAILFGLWQWAKLRRRNEDTKREEPKYNSPREMGQRAMLSECSNLVGFHRIVGDPFIYSQYDDPTNWDGRAEAEYVNKVGGIERTNLRFRFSAHSGTVFARMEGEYERVERWRSEAPEKVRRRSTNYVVGFASITRVRVSGDYSSYDPTKWEATAKVEFVNRAGGTEYTNLPFRFRPHSDDIYAEDSFPRLLERVEEDLAGMRRAYDEAVRRSDAGTVDGPRTWTLQQDAKVVGTLIRFQGSDAIVLRRESDGREVAVPVAYLSEYDKHYLHLTQRKPTSP